jgi:hypothetical protein
MVIRKKQPIKGREKVKMPQIEIDRAAIKEIIERKKKMRQRFLKRPKKK